MPLLPAGGAFLGQWTTSLVRINDTEHITSSCFPDCSKGPNYVTDRGLHKGFVHRLRCNRFWARYNAAGEEPTYADCDVSCGDGTLAPGRFGMRASELLGG